MIREEDTVGEEAGVCQTLHRPAAGLRLLLLKNCGRQTSGVQNILKRGFANMDMDMLRP